VNHQHFKAHTWCADLSADLSVEARRAKSEASAKVERLGYFALDADSKPGNFVFNRTITLKDTWAKIEKKGS
jgi:glutaminyl-tRNA synthetase